MDQPSQRENQQSDGSFDPFLEEFQVMEEKIESFSTAGNLKPKSDLSKESITQEQDPSIRDDETRESFKNIDQFHEMERQLAKKNKTIQSLEELLVQSESRINKLELDKEKLEQFAKKSLAHLKDKYLAALERYRDQNKSRDEELARLRQTLKIKEQSQGQFGSAEEIELNKLRRKQGIGLKQPHVRLGSDFSHSRNGGLADGIYRNRNKDTPCKLKMAFDELQCSRLQREGEILNIIRTNDSLGEYSRYIVAWLYPDRFLTRKSENLYFIDEEGDFSPPAVFPIKSLVFESGGLNLKQFMSNKNHFQVAIAQRVHILEDIIGALNYLHGLSILHFDLKPENIVCFSSGSGLDTRWKLVDFDSSYDVSSSRSHPPVISSSASNDNICVTKEYTSPEVMRALSRSHDAGDLQVTWRLDIWSLGMVAVFLFSNHTLWEVMHPTRPFQNIMVTGITQPQIQLFLSRSFGHKEKSFVEACLQVDPRMRKSASELLRKSLFSTDNSSTLRLTSDSMNHRFAEMESLLRRYREESQSLLSDDLEEKFSELYLCLSNQLERVHHLSVEEAAGLRKEC